MFDTMHRQDFTAPKPRVINWTPIIAAHLDRMNITARDRVLIEGARQGRAAIAFADRERVREILAPVRDSISGQDALWAAIQSCAIGGSSPA